MSKRFTPVTDQEKPRCEQKEEELRKHRQFDTPHALLASNLDDAKPKKGDMNPLGKQSGDMVQDENKLWRKKEEVFGKKWSWGRETFEYSNPEQTSAEAAERPRRPGDAGWAVRGNFGGSGTDVGGYALQRGEVNQSMVKNEKGLWVRKKDAKEEKDVAIVDGYWSCPKCKEENIEKRRTCKACGWQRPAPNLDKPREDPRLEAAKTKGRGTKNAAEEALKALEERRKRQKEDIEHQTEKGLRLQATRSSVMEAKHREQASSSAHPPQQVKAARRVRKFDRWQGVQRSDEDARRLVGKLEGSATIGKSSGTSAAKQASNSPSPSPSRSRSRSSRRGRGSASGSKN
eukprot:CAMPEP_0178420992 /NCGR_PEP_ID=MMETSP0689_2-20121128/26420_1 /TAXON_ID=160604 /ORGANISM="Amphidinium massartii, Strain CS-259" /LENGTH=344 /DNA_ID=CAMNT_0020042495 /DNA_START=51 /DNA_END=1082 /DNA_ORIENTATION=-